MLSTNKDKNSMTTKYDQFYGIIIYNYHNLIIKKINPCLLIGNILIDCKE